jgi:hypothetical protein
MTATNPDSQRPRVVNAAFYIILILGVLSLIAIPWSPGGVIQAPLYLIAAWGIRRERAWSAYGLALLTLVWTAVLFAGGMLREPGLGNARALNLGVAVAFSLALVILLFGAGRAMDRHYSRRGMEWPWISGSVVHLRILSAVRTLPDAYRINGKHSAHRRSNRRLENP